MKQLPTEKQIMNTWVGEPSLPLVSICCITFNQETYIEAALKGFLFQKTNFPFEIIIHDDASTDGTTKIVSQYAEKFPTLVKPIFQTENQYSKGKRIFPLAFSYAKGEYIALCEGDDYWINQYKLQRQVDLLENDQNCSGCFHGCVIDFQNSFKKKKIAYKGKSPIDLRYYLKNKAYISTASLMMRKDCITDVPNWYKNLFAFDFALIYILLMQGNIAYIDKVMSVYRKGVPGSWTEEKLDQKKIDKEYIDHLYALINVNQSTAYKYRYEISLKIKKLYIRYILRSISNLSFSERFRLFIGNIFIVGIPHCKKLIKEYYSKLLEYFK